MSPEARRLVRQERWRRAGVALLVAVVVTALGAMSCYGHRTNGYSLRPEPNLYGRT